MAIVNETPVQITAFNKPTTQGTIKFIQWDKSERTKRALKFGGSTWGLAICSAVLPIVHFILVPSFFIAGPIVAYILMKREKVILGGSGICPNCGKEMKIERSTPQFPLSDSCEHCHKTVEITEAP